MKYWSVASVLAGVLLLGGCSESPEEKAFRAQLVDKALNDDTRKAGDAFLAENATKPGVTVLPSGLQYTIMTQGDGDKPMLGQSVQVHYEGTRIDGEVFDSSYQRGKSAVLPVDRVIKGWREALLHMPVGSTWMLYVPADLAYGATSPSEAIPANSTLIFKVELQSIVQPEDN